MENLLEVKNLKLSFNGPSGRVPAVKGVSLAVAPGETVALVGESGCGKTALCRSIMMLHSDHAQIEEGSITLCGRVVSRMSEAELEKVRGKDAAMVFQDPMSSLDPTFSVGAQIMEPLMLHEKLSRAEARKRALELLRLVEIDNPEQRIDQYPHHFSGGMRQRVAIAIAMACGPRLLIADEPTTALDITTQDKIMSLLKKLCGGGEAGGSGRSDGRRTSMLFVTHDLGLAEKMADRAAVMKDGLIVEEGRTEDIFNAPADPYTKTLIGYAAYGKGKSHYHRSTGGTALREPLVETRGLTKIFELGKKRTHTALNGLDLTVYRGELLGVAGPSGGGKSTLARCLMGIYEPSGGEIIYSSPCRRQMIFQDSASAFNARMTLFDVIAEPLVIERLKAGGNARGARGRGRAGRTEIKEKVFEAMEQVGLPRELAERHPYDVSGGQRQRAAIARALITEPEFLIADEPISSLDVPVQAQIVHLLRELKEKKNLTVLLIAHDLPMVSHVSDRVLEIEKGRLK